MPRNDFHDSHTRQAVNDLVMAEVFLIQATLESAVAIGSGVSALGRHMRQSQEDEAAAESVQAVLQRLGNEVLEPYTSRYQCFREMVNREH